MKFSVIAAMMFIASIVNAQRSATVFHPTSSQFSSSSTRNVIDTLVQSGFIPVNQGGLGCFTGYYHSPDSGYVSGNNQYGDLEKTQFFSLTQSGFAKGGTIEGVLVHFAYKTIGPQSENIVVKIYDADTSGFQPKNLLGTSDAVDLNSISTDGSTTYFPFSQFVSVSDSFFVSVQLPTFTGDTAVILSTVDGCVSHSGWSWELWSNSTWHEMINSWILNVDLAIFPIADVQDNVGINDVNNGNDFSVFPNPASDVLLVKFNQMFSSNLSLELKDQLGRIRYESNDLNKDANNKIEIPVSQLGNGIYSLSIQNGRRRQVSQVAIVH